MNPGPFRRPADRDEGFSTTSSTVRIEFGGDRVETVEGVEGQTVAGVLLGSGRVSWGRSPVTGRPRGVFCGIGVCFDCLVVVDGVRDVRACLRRAVDGSRVEPQDGGHRD